LLALYQAAGFTRLPADEDGDTLYLLLV